jgi:hypothetical protein
LLNVPDAVCPPVADDEPAVIDVVVTPDEGIVETAAGVDVVADATVVVVVADVTVVVVAAVGTVVVVATTVVVVVVAVFCVHTAYNAKPPAGIVIVSPSAYGVPEPNIDVSHRDSVYPERVKPEPLLNVTDDPVAAVTVAIEPLPKPPLL